MSYIDVILGAIAGDVIGSTYEFCPHRGTDIKLFYTDSCFTDDTVMTVAVAKWLLEGGDLVKTMQEYGRKYPNAGYGQRFAFWLASPNPEPYNSWGNGSAMRVSPVGWAFETLEETLDVAKQTAEVSHNHPEGIKGAQATAACVFLARKGYKKREIREYIERTFGYDLKRSCDKIRPEYRYDESCQGSVPESIICFLESYDFESCIRLAVSLGGDADTMAAIAGGIAEAYYGSVPDYIENEVLDRLPWDLTYTMSKFYERFMSHEG
ncbi:MAG: ADP-ribosylglycohydrolase family protein [Bacteroidaceae bacterium]|nr:ADP-ribosylglycohydrolase family protein [Bacteroidaceae bacterium]